MLHRLLIDLFCEILLSLNCRQVFFINKCLSRSKQHNVFEMKSHRTIESDDVAYATMRERHTKISNYPLFCIFCVIFGGISFSIFPKIFGKLWILLSI